jgi:hypothetical protein
MSATKRHHSLQITAEQARALALVLAGQSDREVAETIGVHRVTVTRWRTRDPRFQAALNREREEMLAAARDRVCGLAALAIDAVERELRDPERASGRLGVAVLDRLGLPGEGRVGATSAEQILDSHVRARRSAREYDQVLGALGDGPVTDRERQEALDELLGDDEEAAR